METFKFQNKGDEDFPGIYEIDENMNVIYEGENIGKFPDDKEIKELETFLRKVCPNEQMSDMFLIANACAGLNVRHKFLQGKDFSFHGINGLESVKFELAD